MRPCIKKIGSMDELFGSDDEEEQVAPPPSSDSAAVAKDELFGSDDDEDEVAAPPSSDTAASAKPEQEDTMDVQEGTSSAPSLQTIDAKADGAKPSATMEQDEEGDLFGSDSEDGDVRAEGGDASGFAPTRKPRVKISRLNVPAIPPFSKPPTGCEYGQVLLKCPDFVHVQPAAFDKASFDEETEQKDVPGADQKTFIRWRYAMDEVTGTPLLGADGRPQLQSNAKFVQWSDGRVQLVVGKVSVSVRRNFRHSFSLSFSFSLSLPLSLSLSLCLLNNLFLFLLFFCFRLTCHRR